MAYNSDFGSPLGLLGVEDVEVDFVLALADDGGDAGTELVLGAFKVLLVLGVVVLPVPDGADFNGCALEVASAELAQVRCALLAPRGARVVSQVVFLCLYSKLSGQTSEAPCEADYLRQ